MRRKSFWKSAALTAVAIASMTAAAACGGGDSTTSGTTPTSTPAATSAAVKSMSIGVVQYTQDVLTQAMNAMGGAAQTIKEATYSVSCTVLGDYSATCTVNDGTGGYCDIAFNMNQAGNAFDMEMSCYDFHPATNVVVDGDYSVTVSVSDTAFASASMAAKSEPSTAKVESEDCTITEDMTYPPECSDAQGQTCTEAASTIFMEFLVGSRGLSVTDECGTYVFGSGTTMTTALCGDLQSYIYLFTFTLDGIFNGSAVSEIYSMSCDFSDVAY